MNDQAKTQGWSPDGLFGEKVISARFGYGTFLSSSSTDWSKAFDRHEIDFYGTPLMPVAASVTGCLVMELHGMSESAR